MDTAPVFPNSVEIELKDRDDIKITYDINTGKASFSSDEAFDSVMVCYRIMPYDLTSGYYKRNLASYDSNFYFREDYGKPIGGGNLPQRREELFATPGLNTTGNVSRGISFGNSQNVFVNSNLNMQIEGQLTDDVRLTAVINDQNIPFQPEGNTQQLQDFDRVFVQLDAANSKLTAGDIVMQNRDSHFLRYYKNVQGGQVEVGLGEDSTKNSTTFGGAAISKGKFASIELEALEGVQGPYRLRGPSNERFIIVLANSERVYIDGKLMKRGFDYDYTIDYNLAEITFTQNVLITEFSVIRVDFEFSDRNYTRTIVNAGHYQNYGRATGYVNYYTEQDNPRNPLYELSDQDKELLSSIGDSVQDAYISGVEEVGFSENKILYKKAMDPQGREYYEFSTDPDRAIYEITFTDLGHGNGSYIHDVSKAVNGRVFKYVGPGQGSFEPRRLIPTPVKKQMVTVGGGYELTKYDHVFGEIAFSQHDINRFSNINNENDNGIAFKGGIISKGRKSFIKGYEFTGGVDFEYNDANFRPVDRYRDINFERDWSASPEIRTSDHILNANIGFLKDGENNFMYTFTRRFRDQEVNGHQQNLIFNKSLGRFQVNSTGFMMQNERLFDYSDWKRASVNSSYRTKYVVPGIEYNTDKNVVTALGGDSVTGSAMYFDELKLYVRSADTSRFNFFAEQSFRDDKRHLISEGVLANYSKARTTNAGVNTIIHRNHELVTNFTYRRMTYNSDFMGEQLPDEETVLGRFDYNADFLSRHIRSELTITTGTGRELQREFMFVEVAQGEGTHEWLGDLNGNGVKDLDEFVESVFFDRRNYIKVFVPTDNYVRAYTNSLNYRVNMSAPRNWRDSDKGLIRFFSRFSNVSGWNVNKRILDSDIMQRFSPFISGLAPEDILSVQKNLRSAFFFNRSNPNYGCDLTVQSTENKQFLSQGFETRNLDEVRLQGRLNIKRLVNIRMLTFRNVRANQSNFMQLRNYDIETWSFKPQFSIQPKNTFRISCELGYSDKENRLGEVNEKIQMYSAGCEVRINKVSRRTINGNINYIRIVEDFKETSFNSPVAFEMFEGLMPGNNFTMSVNWQERLSNGLQLSFIYEGRKSESSNLVHIGRMQVSALF
ncbi:hypothetical protein RCC89_17275 [Cytophagaceae bacterium ABcell3]|nr:hypothetical protein RCC89_17275 [Cytophagaceae bacterium ABcell3]